MQGVCWNNSDCCSIKKSSCSNCNDHTHIPGFNLAKWDKTSILSRNFTSSTNLYNNEMSYKHQHDKMITIMANMSEKMKKTKTKAQNNN